MKTLCSHWRKCPPAFRAGFLTALGIIAALWFSFYIFGITDFFFRPETRNVSNPQPAINNVVLTDYSFEQERIIKPGGSTLQLAIIWHAWVHNTYAGWMRGRYYIELRDSKSRLLALYNSGATFPNTPEPREATNIIWPSEDTVINTDFTKSRIYITFLDK